MTANRGPSLPSRRRSLRRRVVATFAGLAILPFAVTLGGLFLVVRQDVAEMQGASLAQEAHLLADQVRLGLLDTDLLAANVAALPEVRRYLDRRGPYPESTLGVLRGTLGGLRRLELRLGAPLRALKGEVSLGPSGQIEYEIPLNNSKGGPAAVLLLSQDAQDIRRLLGDYRRGDQGRAVLLDPSNRILAGPAEVPIPPPSRELLERRWMPFRAPTGTAHLAGAYPIDPASPSLRNWTLMVVQPAGEVFAEFHRATGQAAVFLLLLAGAGLVVAWRLGNRFLSPILQLRQGAEIISKINLGHRLQIHTGDELEELAQDFNRMAESLQSAYENLGDRVRDATVHLQEERNRLAAVLRTMVEGVVATNEAGEVLLMNPRARIALDSGPSSGIGVPIGRVLPAARIEYHLRRIRAAWSEGRDAVEHVVFPLPSGKVLLGLLSGVPGPSGERTGFLLVFRDVGSELDEEEKAKASLRELPELIKGPLSSLRSLAEALLLRPDVAEERRTSFLEGIRDEAIRLAERLTVAEDAAGAVSSSRWPSLPADPRELVREAVESAHGVFSQVEVPQEGVPQVLVEPFSWIAALSSVLRWTAERSSGWSPVEIQLSAEEETVVTTFRLQGPPGDPKELERLIVAPPGEQPLPLGEAVRRNRGEVWGRRAGEGFEVRLALLRASIAPTAAAEGGIVDQQPAFYDFDLFLPRPTVEKEEILRALLTDLDFVVFDTETTGLNPSRGDEVVSLSGIRIRNGRVMAADTFHTLVNPGRRIPASSIDFHGIDDSMVLEAPSMADVLPRFRHYVQDSVLVAHNAAFDKKFLDIAAQRQRMPAMDNPILDTLFLSYGIHKDFEGHHLDAIAQRLGVTVEGRHTSLGDARATAEIFLKLIPLLGSRGVVTLADAKGFCDKMLLMRWQTSRY